MSKHTPGPWARYGSIIRSIACNDRKLADVRVIDDEGQANARLMASSPDLLDALEGLVRINEEHNEAMIKIIGKPSLWNDDYLNASRAAIAKAKGEES